MAWWCLVLCGFVSLFTSSKGSTVDQCADAKVKAIQSIAESVDVKGSQLLQVMLSLNDVIQGNKNFLTQRDQRFLDYLDEHLAAVSAIAQSIKTDTFLDAIKRIDGVLDNLERKFQSHQENIVKQMNALQTQLDSNKATLTGRLSNLEDENKFLQSRLTELQSKLTTAEPGLNMTAVNGACPPPFENAGNDCVHIGSELMNWTDARDYCRGLGGDLMVPSRRNDIILHAPYDMKVDHHILFDLLQNIRGRMKLHQLSAWLGARVVTEGSAEWISPYGGTVAKENGYRGDFLPGDCIRALVNNQNQFAVWVPPCSWSLLPACHYRV